MSRNLTACAYLNALLVVALSLYLFCAPVLILAHDLREPALSAGGTPQFAYPWHRKLSADFEPWARQRVASGTAGDLSVQDIAATE